MNEVEVKILNIDRKKIEAKLISLGAKKVFDDKVSALFFKSKTDKPHKHLQLRLRTEGTKAVLTLKTRIPDKELKIRDEHEVEVSDFNEMQIILEGLGYIIYKKTRKHRTSYALDDAHFEFDKYLDEFDFIPEFLEIEATTPKTIHKYADLLGIKKEDCKPWSLKDILKNKS